MIKAPFSYRFLQLTCAVFVLCFSVGVSAQEQEQKETPDRARFCQVNHAEQVAPRTADGLCVPPYYENEGGLCVVETEAHNTFSYIARDDKSIDFGLSYWFGFGAHCGITGHAKPTETGWRYEHNMESKNPHERCVVNITLMQDIILFDTEPHASCRQNCGAQGYLNGVFIPLSSFESNDVTEQSFAPELFFNTPCRSSP